MQKLGESWKNAPKQAKNMHRKKIKKKCSKNAKNTCKNVEFGKYKKCTKCEKQPPPANVHLVTSGNTSITSWGPHLKFPPGTHSQNLVDSLADSWAMNLCARQ